jgi:S1-C subfamily serine protease
MLAVIAVAAVVGGAAGAAIGLGLSGDGTTSGGAATTLPLVGTPVAAETQGRTAGPSHSPEAIYRMTSPGVVVITDTQVESIPPTPFTLPGQRKVSALGSGFVVDDRGDILTNDHVVRGATDVRVGFGVGTTYPAKIIGTDPSSDLAVVRIDAPRSVLHPLDFADSSRVQVGDPAYAIGNPFGLDRTMTAGIISATGRDIEAPNGLTIPDAIQTDAPINHGNSGGPLLDRFGHVVGVNAQIQGGTVDANVGVGFAIPSDTARTVSQQLIASGHAEHPWLGVQIETIDPAVAKVVRGLPTRGVAIVRVVAGGPAAKAGLVAGRRRVTVGGATGLVGGDAITEVDGRPVTSSAELESAVALHKPGDTVTLEVVRNGVSRTVRVTLGNTPT